MCEREWCTFLFYEIIKCVLEKKIVYTNSTFEGFGLKARIEANMKKYIVHDSFENSWARVLLVSCLVDVSKQMLTDRTRVYVLQLSSMCSKLLIVTCSRITHCDEIKKKRYHVGPDYTVHSPIHNIQRYISNASIIKL